LISHLINFQISRIYGILIGFSVLGRVLLGLRHPTSNYFTPSNVC